MNMQLRARLTWSLIRGLPNFYGYRLVTLYGHPHAAALDGCPMGTTLKEAKDNLANWNEQRAALGMDIMTLID